MTERIPDAPSTRRDVRSRYAHRQGGGAAYLLAAVIFLAALFKAALAGAATIGSGYSGMWYDPARSGEGLQLEILSPDVALVEWYTYDAQGKQRWIQGVGSIAGDTIQLPQVYTTQGGKFGAAFNPDDVKISVVGNLSLTFGDCNTGTFKYTAFGQSQTLPIQHLTLTMGAGCAPINGVPGEPVMSYAGQSGSWYNTTRSGEGFDLQWLSNGAAIVTWYTYDTAGNQVWLLGVGRQQDGAIVFDQMAITNGPKFGAAYDKAALQQSDWGSLTLTLDCNGGAAHYASKQTAFGSGDLTLTRLTHLQQPACPYVKPKFSDLYSVTWDEIPIEMGTPANPNYISAESIAEDGTVAGRSGSGLMLWHPDTRTWENVPQNLATMPVFISPDGSKVIATEYIGGDQSLAGDPQHILLWQRSSGFEPLPGDVVNESWHTGVSHNFNYVVGYGRNGPNDPNSVWVRGISGVQQILPTTTAIPSGTPAAVANDGNTVVGATLRFINDWPMPVAVRWDNGGPPTIMQNPSGQELAVASACDADCGIVFGAGMFNSNDPHTGSAWLLKNDGTFEYFSQIPDAVAPGRYSVLDTAPDGSIAVGAYQTSPPVAGYPAATVTRAYIWTEATGTVSVRSLVSELGIGDDDWDEITTVRISPDGTKILLGGLKRLDLHPNGDSRAVVLHLTPKASAN